MILSRRRLRQANFCGPRFATESGPAYLETNTQADFKSRDTGASKLRLAQINVRATAVGASKTVPPIPRKHGAAVELAFIGLCIDVCLNVLR